MNYKDKIVKAKLKLVLNNPFFASLALGMEYIEDQSTETAKCNGKAIKYNPEFINNLDIDTLTGLIAHEILHPALLHHIRIENKDFQVFNQAADFAINPILKENGFKLPEGALIDQRFSNMPAENIYSVLMQEKEQQEKQGNKPGNENQPGKGQEQQQGKQDESKKPENFGQVEKFEGEKEQQESEMKQKLVQAANNAKNMGKLSKSIQTYIDELINPKINWREVLNRFVAEIARNDYSWSKPSTRYLPMGLYLPKLESVEVGKVVFIIDTSGSINREMLNTFVSELFDIKETFNFPVTVIHSDSEVKKVEELTDENIVPVGGGGTDFRPALKYIEENIYDAKAVVYFTDGMCSRLPESFDLPLIWAIYGKYPFKPKFGEVINIE